MIRRWAAGVVCAVVVACAHGGDGPASFAELAERLRTEYWSARVELWSRVDGERLRGPRRMAVTWSGQTSTATLRTGGLRVVAGPGRLVAWNPLHAGVVFEVVDAGAGAGELLARSLPPLLLPPLAIATGSMGPVVGSDDPVEWAADDNLLSASYRDGVNVATMGDASPWVSWWTVTEGSVEHALSFAPGASAVELPADLANRERVPSPAGLAGRAGDVRPGERLPLVRLGVVGDDGDGGSGGWSPGAAFSTEGREPAALVFFLVPASDEGAAVAAEVVRETRRVLLRRAVIAGRTAEAFPGVVARAVFVVPPIAYDPTRLASAARAWAMPAQPGFDEAEAVSPGALWAPPEELLVRVAPDAHRVVVVVSSAGRVEAVRPFDAADSEVGLAVELADAIAPELVPVVIGD